jgi:hypothetical protein
MCRRVILTKKIVLRDVLSNFQGRTSPETKGGCFVTIRVVGMCKQDGISFKAMITSKKEWGHYSRLADVDLPVPTINNIKATKIWYGKTTFLDS